MINLENVGKALGKGGADVGGGLAVWSAGATFITSWVYCMQEYGFLFGFGLGWLPSAMLAAIVGVMVNYLWAYIIGLFVLALLAALLQNLR